MTDKKEIKWYQNRQIITLIIFVVVLALAVLASYIFAANKEAVNAESNSTALEKVNDEEICEIKRLLDNICVDKGQENFVPWAIMIENNIDSRPPAGIEHASIVFEAIAESSITRFLAIFPGDLEIKRIGPVRSARPYYLDWATEFDPVYLHVGGSPQALAELAVSSMYDLDQFVNGPYYWRDKKRYAPHNVYTSSKLINEAIEDKNWDETASFDTWIFKAEEDLENRPESQEIKINYDAYYYDVVWKYDREQNDYIRYQMDSRYKTEQSEIRTKNIAVVYTENRVIDDYGRLYTRTLGEGEAVVFHDGIAIEGNWKKPNAKSRLRFFDSEGNEIEMNEGKTWIAIVPDHMLKAEY